MSYPPRQARRKRLGRALAFAAIGFVVVVAVGGFVYWQKTRFPARSERLAGTPVVLRIQSGVPARDLRAIRLGLRVMDRYMKRHMGGSVQRPVEARVARESSCRPFQDSGGATMGEAMAGFLCIDTKSLGWQYLVHRDFIGAASIAAHEYVHVLQGELGCLPPPHDQPYRWLMEGMASDLAWRALVAAGRATDARTLRTIRGDEPLSPGLEPLASYERDGGRDQQYALWHLAVRRLGYEAAARGARNSVRPELALRNFCARVGRGRPWRVAFAQSFGLPVNRFYASFEAARRHGNALLH